MNLGEKTVVRSNEIIESIYSLTLVEHRIIIMVTSMVDVKSKDFDCKQWFTIQAKDYAETFNVKLSGSLYANLKEAANRLYERRVAIPQSTRSFHKTRWVQDCKYRESDGAIALRFAESIRPYIVDLQQYTKYKMGVFSKFSSIHTARFYEILLKWLPIGCVTIELEDLRDQLGLYDSYEIISNFKRFIADNAIASINEHSDIRVKAQYKKTGRRFTSVKFTITQKKRARNSITQKEIELHARVGETTEQVKARLIRELCV